MVKRHNDEFYAECYCCDAIDELGIFHVLSEIDSRPCICPDCMDRIRSYIVDNKLMEAKQ